RSAMKSPPLASAARIVEAARADGRFVVAYAGGHAPNHDLDTLIDAAEMVRDERFCFILMGSGSAREALIRRAQAAGLEHVHFLERASRGVALSTLSLADAVYVGIAEGSLYRYGIGLNKIYDAMFVGRPIVAAYTAGNDPVTDAECGMTSPAGDVEGVAAALRALARMETSSREAMGLRGHRFVLQNHDYRRLAARFLEEIEVARAAM
ncbi:MAG: glycosyltransferase, partial [Planctomycetota bacterium]|nr:glycosyltransferase [Planctomycetota bacterium]